MQSSTVIKIKQAVGRIPFLGPFGYRIYQKLFRPFEGSERYWQSRYNSGGNSGDGSYDELAQFKAKVINEFVIQNNVSSVIEYGCGDGNQLSLGQYPRYKGFDVSQKAISICMAMFAGDDTKSFGLIGEDKNESADLTLSLDVIYHLVEDEIFNCYMERLFDSSRRFVIIYSSNTSENAKRPDAHVKHRHFSKWVTTCRPEWMLVECIRNKYPLDANTGKGSFADFYIYTKAAGV